MREIVTGPEVVRWVEKRMGGTFETAQGIGVELDGRLIGGVVYNEFNGASLCMHTAGEPGEPWLYRKSLWCFFDYPFNVARVNVVIAPVGEGNTKSRTLVEGVGFRLAHPIPNAHPTGALMIYTMTPDQCRWIERRDERKAA